MVKSVMPKEKWAEVAPAYVKDGKQHYFLRVNPVELEGSITSIQEVFDHVPTDTDKVNLYNSWLDIVVASKLRSIVEYDKSEAVNSFTVNGMYAWLDKATRVGLVNSLSMEKTAGRSETDLYLNSVRYHGKISDFESMLVLLELYAKDCYSCTENHKTAVKSLHSIEEVESYDYKTGYPERLHFSVPVEE